MLQVFTTQFTDNSSCLRVEQLVSNYLQDNPDLAYGLEYEVQTFIIDLRNAFLQQKIEWIKTKFSSPQPVPV